MAKQNRRIVITGMGAISPLGNSIESLWQRLSTGTSGVDLLRSVPVDNFPVDIGGEANEFQGNIDDFGDLEKKLKRNVKKGLKLMCREIQMGVAAAQLAMAHSGLADAAMDLSLIHI